jgi:lysyl-tRNA synthetase class I
METIQESVQNFLDKMKEVGYSNNNISVELVSQWLGHSRLETMFIYAYADTEQKRKAIENAIPEDSTLKEYLNADRYSVEDDETIKRLYGLK